MATVYKEKLAGSLSYPVGIEVLRAELGEVPQADVLTVSFHTHAGRAAEIELNRRSGVYYPVLAARFRHCRLGYSESNEMRERGFYDPTWSIAVYAVTRENRAVARKLLCEEGIPAVAVWLRTPRNETWLQGRKEITVCFNEKDKTIIVIPDSG